MCSINIDDINFDTPILQIVSRKNVPLKFSQCNFQNYIPDKKYPTQMRAKEQLMAFKQKMEDFNSKKRCCSKTLNKLFRINKKPNNVYIDGVFGVGKTHLLSSIGNKYKGKAIFISFSELMYLIAYFDLLSVVEKMSKFQVVLLDEFELDDPGDAMMGINFVRELSKTDSVIVTTSNTTPTSLGGRKFDMMVFKERIGKLINYFDIILIDGKDYRMEEKPNIQKSQSNLKKLFQQYKTKNRKKLYVTFDDLLKKLRSVHPVRYINFNNTIDAIFIENLRKFTDDELLDALRFSYLTDVLYYGDVDIFISSKIDLWHMFSEDLRDGKFKNKISRCISRISEKGLFIEL